MSKMNNTVFVIRNGQVAEVSYNDLDQYIETTTRPTGVGTKYYLTTTDVYDVIRADGSLYETYKNKADADLNCDQENGESIQERPEYCVARWATWGGPEVIVSRHESEAEAQAAVEDIWIMDIYDNGEESIFFTREEAQNFLNEDL